MPQRPQKPVSVSFFLSTLFLLLFLANHSLVFIIPEKQYFLMRFLKDFEKKSKKAPKRGSIGRKKPCWNQPDLSDGIDHGRPRERSAVTSWP
jgi:hypothetical protein